MADKFPKPPTLEESHEVKRLKAFFTACVYASLTDPNPDIRIGAVLCMEKWGGRDVSRLLGMAFGRYQDNAEAGAAARLSLYRCCSTEKVVPRDEVTKYVIPFLKTLVGGSHAEGGTGIKAREFLAEAVKMQTEKD